MFENMLWDNKSFRIVSPEKRKEVIKKKFMEYYYSEIIKDKIIKRVSVKFIDRLYKLREERLEKIEKVKKDIDKENKTIDIIEAMEEFKNFLKEEGIADYAHRFKRARIEAKAKMIRLSALGIDVITDISEDYPESLINIYDRPRVLYLLGDRSLLNPINTVGIVGSRECSFQSGKLAKNITKKLADKQIVTVSGLASGIDGIVHFESIKNNAKTIAVIGTGFSPNVFYPKINYNLFKDIINYGGLVISEYEYEQRGSRYTFPKRNRIIAALSSSLIVVQARVNSGSIITADKALEYGKDIYVPLGLIGDSNFLGTNMLIRDGAIPITDLSDIDDYF